MCCWLVLMNGAAFSTRHSCGHRDWHSLSSVSVSLSTICMDLFAHGQASTQRAHTALQAICLGGMLSLTAAGLYGMSPNMLHMQQGRSWAGQCPREKNTHQRFPVCTSRAGAQSLHELCHGLPCMLARLRQVGCGVGGLSHQHCIHDR